MSDERVAGGLRNSLTGKVLAVSAALGVVLVTILVANLGSFAALGRENDARARAGAIVTSGAAAEQAVIDMEIGLRGFVLTRERRFLAPWYNGRKTFRREIARLQDLTGSDASGDEGVLSAIARQGVTYIERFSGPIIRGGLGGRSKGDVQDITAEGKRRLDAMRGLFARLDAINNEQARDRVEAARDAVSNARTTVIAGLAAVLLLVLLTVMYLVRSVSLPVRRIAQAADRLSRGDFSARASVQGPGEVALLGTSFNEMASSIERAAGLLSAQNERLEATGLEAQRVATELAAQQELAVDLVATIGYDGCFKRVNPAWERTLGYSPDELASTPFIGYVHPDDRERTEAEAARLADDPTDTINFENRYRTKAGLYRWLEWNVRPIAEQQLMYAVARDVTQRKEADLEIRAARAAAEHANQAKSEFLSRMSHELRTPLNAILGFGQLLEMDVEGEQRESVDQILRGGRHLLELIDEVLDISRIEAGAMRMFVEAVDVVSAMGDAVALIAPVARAEGIGMTIEHGNVSDCYVRADRRRLRQVILNLLSNAVKYNRPRGSVVVTVDVVADRVRIDVADTGLGLAESQLDRLFVAFDRLDADAGPVEGTGLGLALSRSLAEQMGATLSARSTPGEGSVFTLELERAANPVDEHSLEGARLAGREATGIGARTILYIEDSPANAKLVEQAFAGQPDVRLLEAQQGSRGLELAKAHRPDLILLDLHLPDMEGSSVLARLQADPDTSELPVIVLSADATRHHISELLASGASAYLTKPLDIRKFLGVVNHHMIREVV